VEFAAGDAAATGLPDGVADIVFARALVHHVPDRVPVAAEARRLLRPGGRYLVQDRTPDDVAQPGSPTNPRGWFFTVFPRLLDAEAGRRPTAQGLSADLADGGLGEVGVTSLVEVRRRYPDREAYLAEIATRTGRSILHELDDDELAHLVAELRLRLPGGPLVEQDRWTLWTATRDR
jgi:SAM-dependent methyltransferase